jgi:3-oxoacyl-[acyl-carrier-protein] synthase II
MAERRVVVTGTGVVSPFGVGARLYWESISAGRTASRLISTFDVSGMPTRFAASLPMSNEDLEQFIENKKSLKTLSRAGMFAVIAAQEAATEAGLDPHRLNPYRVGTSIGAGGVGLWDVDSSVQLLDIAAESFGTSAAGARDYGKAWRNTFEKVHPLQPLKGLSNIPTAHIAINHNARGNCQTITTACTSSAQAIGEAYRQIKYDIADVMIAGGSDSLINPNGLLCFSLLGVMSKNNDEYATAARPFDARRDGFMVGEGSAVFILEELEHCRRRKAEPYAELIGYASTSDAYRLTDEPPEAWGSIEAMRSALASARVNASEVDYINAHGTGTRMNDSAETFAIRTVFGEHATGLAVSSTKSMIGHLVAAAGAVEFAACLMAMKHRVIPPTINYEVSDPACDLDYVPNTARDAAVNVILSNSFGFGGQNACLVMKRFA